MDKLNAAEAVMGFAAWLTSQPQTIKMSSHDLASPACEAVGMFLAANGFDIKDIRNDYHKILVHPTGKIPYTESEATHA